MKLNHIFALFFALFFVFGCSPQPVGNTLLTSAKNGGVIDTTTTADDGELNIQPDNTAMTVNIDNSDRVEITGSCKDLDRKKNRIIVEVFSGDDETVDPYITNLFSDKCQNVLTNPGLLTTDTCLWVTKGLGVVEDIGLPTQRSFPQCHGGRFGFTVKLGKILLPTPPNTINNKYTVRFKLRTLDGILADSAFARVSVARDLNIPTIDTVTYTNTGGIKCNIKSSPARFNPTITYQLDRTCTDATGTTSAPTPIFSNLTTSGIIDGISVFSWNDVAGGANIILQGASYNYTLTSTEKFFNYAPSAAPMATSSSVSCNTTSLRLNTTPLAPTPGTCYIGLMENTANPSWPANVTYQWAYGDSAGWVGSDFSSQSPPFLATCGNTTNCTQPGLTSGKFYYFAVREVGGGQVGRWSEVFQCKPP